MEVHVSTFEPPRKAPSHLLGAFGDVPDKEVRNLGEVNSGLEQEAPPDNQPWVVRVTPTASGGNDALNLRSDAGTGNGIVTTLEVGTELEVTGQKYIQNDEGRLELWYQVQTEDGQTGYVRAGRFETVSGVAAFEPYVLADGRDGSSDSAMKHASGLVGGGTEYGEPADGGPPRCLGFVNDCFGITQAADRCPEMYNPSPYDESAWGAFQKLSDSGLILNERPIPEGAIVFFEPSEQNEGYGHAAIVTGEMAPDGTPYVLTSGWEGSPEVKRMSLAELEAETGAVAGYTTPEEAFTDGTYGGGSQS